MQLSEKSKNIQQMFDKISFQYDFLNRLLSFHQDVRWRKHMIKRLPTSEFTLYDVACGTGDVVFEVAKHKPNCTNLVGFDISQGMLNQANLKLARMQNKNHKIQFQQSSAELLEAPDASAHALTIAFGLRNVDNREQALNEFNRVLKKDGSLFILDFFPANSSFFSQVFKFYFQKVLPSIGGLFSDKKAYQYLPHSVVTMPNEQEFTRMLSAAGFSNIEQKSWLSGAVRLFACKK